MEVKYSVPNPQSKIDIKIKVPEYIDISLHCKEMFLLTSKKIQGNFHATCNDGELIVDKLRGSELNLLCGSSSLTVKKSLEGNSVVQCGKINAKMVNGDKVELNSSTTANIGAIYGTYSEINARKGITIGFMRGNLEAINMSEGDISVKGLEGSIKTFSEKGNINLQINKLDHQLSGNNHSVIIARNGSVRTVFDPEIKTKLSMHQSADVPDSNINVESSAYIESLNLKDLSNDAVPEEKLFNFLFHLKTIKDFMESINNKMGSNKADSAVNYGKFVIGLLTGEGSSTRKPIFRSKNAQSGKISLPGAEQSWLNKHNYYEEKKDDSIENVKTKDSVFFIQASDKIKVEAMSWIDAIRKKHLGE